MRLVWRFGLIKPLHSKASVETDLSGFIHLVLRVCVFDCWFWLVGPCFVLFFFTFRWASLHADACKGKR